MMLGTERERVFKFYFSRLQQNSRVNLIFSGLFLNLYTLCKKLKSRVGVVSDRAGPL